MKINLSEDLKNIILFFITILLPIILIGVGVLTNFISVGYYILSIFWFGMGLIFYNVISG